MQSRNAYILGSFVIPEGATSGARIEFDAENGIILVYDSNSDLIGWIAPQDGTDANGKEYFAGVGMHPYSNTLQGGSRTSVTLEANNGRLLFTRNPNHPGPPADFVWDGEIRGYNPDNLATGSGRLYISCPSSFPNGDHMEIVLRSVSTDGTTLVHRVDICPEDFDTNAARANATQVVIAGFLFRQTYDDVSDSYTDEVWQNLPLAGAWVADVETPQYKLMADGTVLLRGNMKDGATANGTTIANLPAGYRPTAQTRLITAEKQTGLSWRHLGISSGGVITVWNCTTAHICLDGARFPVI